MTPTKWEYIFLRLRTDLFAFVPFVPPLLLLPLPPTLPQTSPVVGVSCRLSQLSQQVGHPPLQPCPLSSTADPAPLLPPPRGFVDGGGKDTIAATTINHHRRMTTVGSVPPPPPTTTAAILLMLTH